MKDYLLEQFLSSDFSNGLLIVPAPTGAGKSYQSVQAIYDYVHRAHNPQPVLFLTNRIKNLPEQELRKTYERHGNKEAFDREVLVLRSNFDCVERAIHDISVPAQFVSFPALKAAFERLSVLQKASNPYARELADQLRENIRTDLEPAFRQEITNHLIHDFNHDPEACRRAIRNNRQYQWISRYYPAVFTDDYKILLLSIKKLMHKNSTLVEPSYDFLSERMLRNRLVCIDEFDASKSDILDSLIEKAQSLSEDYLDIFLRIHSGFASHRFSRDLEQVLLEPNSARLLDLQNLRIRTNEIFEQFSLFYSLKTADDNINNGRNFLFHDSSYHTILSNHRTRIRTVADVPRKQVVIHFDTKEEYEQHLQEPHISIHSLLRSIYGFLCSFQRFVQQWAKSYAQLINARRHATQDYYSQDRAEETIYSEFKLTDSQIQLLRAELSDTRFTSWNSGLLAPDLSFYSNGFRLFEFIDDDRHLSQTELRYLQMQNTPERVLLFICRLAKVVGLSATADLPTVIGNYDLNYLKDQLRDRFIMLAPSVADRIRAQLQTFWEPYKNGSIRIEARIVDRTASGLELSDRLEQFLPAVLIPSFENKLRFLSSDSYVLNRYCNILSTFRSFLTTSDIRSLLCLNMVLPAENKPEFDEAFLRDTFQELVRELSPQHPADMAVLRGGTNFEEAKTALLSRLEQGEKIFVFSSYATLGAGQNIPYAIPKGVTTVPLNAPHSDEDPRFLKKDFDALYLGDVTNITANLYSDQLLSNKDLFKFCYQVECLYQNDEISLAELDTLLEVGIRRSCSTSKSSLQLVHFLTNAPSIRRQATRDVLQAIGRLCRSFQKSPTIYIFTTQNLLRKLDLSCLENSILCPEMECLCQLCQNSPSRLPEDTFARNKAERIATQGNAYILRMLSNEWNNESISLWKGLRQTVMAYPCASQSLWETDPVIHRYYLPQEQHRPHYLYAQKSDFSNIYIDLPADTSPLGFAAEHSDCWIGEVSEENARLSLILQFPGMREYFEQNGWATSFEPSDYILSPALFHNIYKGALGEMAGRFILEQILGISLTEITDPEYFERFDFILKDGIYLDFKHWKPSMKTDDAKMREKIQNKLDSVHGKRAYIINLIAPEAPQLSESADQRIIEINGLIDSNGNIIKPALELLGRELL